LRTKAEARITWDTKASRYRIAFDYHADLIAFLKNLPKHTRAYDGFTRSWLFDREYLELVTEQAQEYFPDVVTEYETTQKKKPRAPKPAPLSRADFVAIEFYHAVGIEGAKAAYHKAATLLHPDLHGGDGEPMRFLNALWEELEALYK
jgi:hypothetical protein